MMLSNADLVERAQRVIPGGAATLATIAELEDGSDHAHCVALAGQAADGIEAIDRTLETARRVLQAPEPSA